MLPGSAVRAGCTGGWTGSWPLWVCGSDRSGRDPPCCCGDVAGAALQGKQCPWCQQRKPDCWCGGTRSRELVCGKIDVSGSLMGPSIIQKFFKMFEMRRREERLKTRGDECLVVGIYLEALRIKFKRQTASRSSASLQSQQPLVPVSRLSSWPTEHLLPVASLKTPSVAPSF